MLGKQLIAVTVITSFLVVLSSTEVLAGTQLYEGKWAAESFGNDKVGIGTEASLYFEALAIPQGTNCHPAAPLCDFNSTPGWPWYRRMASRFTDAASELAAKAGTSVKKSASKKTVAKTPTAPKPAATPAPTSTMTWGPSLMSALTLSGTRATRRSPSAISLGTPTIN